MVELEIDGKKTMVEEGASIIEAADEMGIYIPRFCYHKKLSIAANCRMCLVEVEKSGKTLPACATPVTPGMKVFTKSKKTIEAQRYVMEFLLINHPLDCPICDQGGECELQDLVMGFGRSHSDYEETKRAVFSENIGPLIETEMTRCIQCTRCVRFGEEIAGFPELGVINRGEKEAISTYVKHFMQSELSGNIIDICPVGALTDKPARYRERGWELREVPAIAPHDCVGGNIFLHSRWQEFAPQRKIMRAVPRENEVVNETWMSDRDRFGHFGLYHHPAFISPE
nr:2Fe-2S iron-sulfur cluster-binding protein [Coxiella-like endosymbiont of Rhipicephalus sanguineus]